MKKIILIGTAAMLVFLLSFTPKVSNNLLDVHDPTIQDIINSYKKEISKWPKPNIDEGVAWKEFALIKRDSAYFINQEKPKVILGKMLFFDPKLSGSNQVSCSSCHDPEIGWTDRRRVSLGNDHLEGSRNTPTILNVGARKTLFWDGKSETLEDQAINPIAAHHEMNMEPPFLPGKLSKINGYKKLFKDAYGDEKINMDRITEALAEFQKTVSSQPSRFDQFLDGKHNALSDQEIYGMHIFRTKARCMNCHNGQYLTDEKFHNIGLTYYKRKYEDLGVYAITKKPEDVGRFRTPQLRDLMITRPWMHNGLFDDLEGIVNLYNSGMHMNDPKPDQKQKDPNYPVTDPLLKKLDLTKEETQAVVKFLESMTGTTFKMRRPEFPVN